MQLRNKISDTLPMILRINLLFFFTQEITFSMLSEMNLLDMCVQESLRMYPPAGRSVSPVTAECNPTVTDVRKWVGHKGNISLL